ncbi:MAG: hypothetical protein GX590_00180 [Lentisphaerae bacterium]|nr:hypothetical protein [Lentisphaerota bacterium]
MKPFKAACGLTWLTALVLGIVLVGCENDNELSGNEFTLSPANYRFTRTNDFVVSIGVHGAVLPVTWNVSDRNLGKVTGVTVGSNQVFVTAGNYERTPGKYGVNTVVVRDARGWQAIATIEVREGL